MEGDANPFDAIETEVLAKAAPLGEQMAETVKDWLAQICTKYLAEKRHQHLGDERHSLPGEHPRYETGRLLESIASNVRSNGHNIVITVDTDVSYAVPLQGRMNRPIFVGLLEQYEPIAIDLVSESLQPA